MKKSSLLEVLVVLTGLVLMAAALYFILMGGQNGSANLNSLPSLSEKNERVRVPISYENRIKKGDQLKEADLLELAANEYAFAADISKDSPLAYHRLGETYLTLGENEKAARQLELALNLDPQNTQINLDLAKAKMRLSLFDEAIALLEPLQNNQEATLFIAMIQAYFGDHNNAEKNFKSLTQSENESISSIANTFAKDYDTHNEKLDGSVIYLEALITESYAMLREYALVRAMAERILNAAPDYRDVWKLLGYAELKTENHQAAEDAFKAGLAIDELKPEMHYFLGESHFKQEEYEEAILAFERALLTGFEEELEIHRFLADSYSSLERFEEALSSHEKILKIDSKSAEQFISPIWIALSALEDYDRALSLALDASDQFPEEAMSSNLLSWVYIERKEWAAAENAAQKALNLDPNLAEAHFNYGQVLEEKNDTQAAKNAYKEAYELAALDNAIKNMAAEKFNSLSNPTQ